MRQRTRMVRLGLATLAASALSAAGGAVPPAGADLPPLELQKADLSVSLSVGDVSPTVGDEVAFTLKVTNSGPDAVPASPGPLNMTRLRFGTWALTAGPVEILPGSLSASQGTVDVFGGIGYWAVTVSEPLPAGSTATLTGRVRILRAESFQLLTQVELAALADPDSSPENCDPNRDNVPDLLEDDCAAVRLDTATPPTCGPVVAPVVPVPVGATVTATGPFSDANVRDTHTAEIAWGDGTTSAASVTEASGSGTAGATHAYATPGVYTLTLTVTDSAHMSATCTFEFVTVFDPQGGFVTGGGWITSPPGAYAANPSLTGKATFGFVSKYKRGSDTPTGNTSFNFKAGGLSFESSSYDLGSLVVGGAKAQYKGSGTINGAGDYAFKVWAIDGDAAGGGGVDTFRIKIWDKTGGVVYDNQMGEGDDAAPTTTLGGGSISIHK